MLLPPPSLTGRLRGCLRSPYASVVFLVVAAMLGPHSTGFADGGTCTVTISREIPADAGPGVDDIPISSMEATPNEKVDVKAVFKAT